MTAGQAKRIGELLGVPVTSVRTAGAQHGYQHLTARLADGRQAFVKAALAGDEATAEAFAAEANGLRWLAEAGAVPLPRVLGVSHDLLVIEPHRTPRRSSAPDWPGCTPRARPPSARRGRDT
jgi:fructosamine-3-kinase